ncbi:hypothetical protein S40293_10602 [Stachybotrys chartarum IBT 40293]|nr:hypothetical protein S40293_10602 [Stachybotrys chartarum IBT 40293]
MLLYSFRARHCYSHDLGPLLVRHLQVLERLQEEICSASGRGASAPLPPQDILERMIYLNLLADPPTPSIHTRTISGGNQDDNTSCRRRPRRQVASPSAKTNTAKMQISLDWSFGKAASQGTSDEHLYLSAVGLESVLNPEESALLEIVYAVARVIHVYPYINVPDGEPEVDVGEERQVLTLAVSCADGCRGSLGTQA